MGFSLKKVLKRAVPKPGKLVPEFVKKNETLTKLSNLNIAQHTLQTQSAVAKAPDWKTATVRPLLREQHELLTTPFSKTADKILRRNALPAGPEKDALTADINSETLKRGHVGIAAAAVVTGGTAGAALGAGNKVLSAADTAAVLRANPTPGEAPFRSVDTWPDPNAYPDVLQQMYRTYPAGSPYAQRRTVSAAGASGEGLLTKAVRGMWNLLVPAAKRAS